jgi:hypothetical protein
MSDYNCVGCLFKESESARFESNLREIEIIGDPGLVVITAAEMSEEGEEMEVRISPTQPLLSPLQLAWRSLPSMGRGTPRAEKVEPMGEEGFRAAGVRVCAHQVHRFRSKMMISAIVIAGTFELTFYLVPFAEDAVATGGRPLTKTLTDGTSYLRLRVR